MERCCYLTLQIPEDINSGQCGNRRLAFTQKQSLAFRRSRKISSVGREKPPPLCSPCGWVTEVLMYCEKILHPPSHLQHHDKQQFINPGFPLTFLIEGSFFSSFQHIISLNRMLSIYFLVFDLHKRKIWNKAHCAWRKENSIHLPPAVV